MEGSLLIIFVWLPLFHGLIPGQQPTEEQTLLKQLFQNYESASRPVYRANLTVGVTFGLTLIQIAQLVTDEQMLIRKLFANYDPGTRPVFDARNVINVTFGLSLILISDMDEVNQVLTINVWIEQEWKDERIRWNPAEYNGLSILRIPCEKLWLPDIVLYNSADDFKGGFMPIRAVVQHTGLIFWSPPAKLRSTCKIDMTYFPFDDQTCILKFGSWTYDLSQMNISSIRERKDEVETQYYVKNGEWDLVNVTVERHTVSAVIQLSPPLFALSQMTDTIN
ncbi:hypothetical protein Ciccas_010820 [Cichlidogyrus casuarinus]|uniref:Neurotransmitter-gated ion-channel ligand-binding domain-containing protein n=1 Tax=Cichlidogyrus casuarinus TaxID=1844966 RepID=A0ABD2PT17_9PLAT